MTVTCPKCNKQYLIEKDKIPEVKSVARCKDCGGKIIIDPFAIEIDPEEEKPLPTSQEAEEETAEPENPGEDKPDIEEEEAGLDQEDLLRTFPWLAELSALPLDLGEIFLNSRKKGYLSRRNRRAAEALKAVAGCLPAILAEDERIIKAAKGSAYFPAEIPYANTILTLPANHYTVIATNNRLIFCNLDWRQKRCGEYFYQLPYTNIREIRRGVFRDCLVIKSRSGWQMRLTSLSISLSREIVESVIEIRHKIANWNIAPVRMEFLCPVCFAPLAPLTPQCSECGSHFKSSTTAFIRSLLLPGLGASYLNHRLLAACEFAIFISFLAILGLTITLKLIGGIIFTLCALLLFHAFSGFLSYMTARKGLMIDDRKNRIEEKAQSPETILQNTEIGVISQSEGQEKVETTDGN